MNRGVLQSSPVEQIMAAGNHDWWSINNMRPSSQHSVSSAPPNFLSPPYAPPPPSSSSWVDDNHELPDDSVSWSQLLLGGLVDENDDQKCGLSNLQIKNELEKWEEQLLHQHPNGSLGDVRHEHSSKSYMYQYGRENEEYQRVAKPAWSPAIMPVSSPTSCVTTLNSNHLVDFSRINSNKSHGRHPPPDRSSECNSTGAAGFATKKAKVQPSSSQSSFKVRKEKLGDRITALHQLVSPFGKTDTASVLLEAIGYIRFLQSQIEALSLPYLGNKSGNVRQQHQQQNNKGDKKRLHLEDSGQGSCEESEKDLRSRGLCLVPISYTLQVGSDNGADYWAPALGGGGGGFR